MKFILPSSLALSSVVALTLVACGGAPTTGQNNEDIVTGSQAPAKPQVTSAQTFTTGVGNTVEIVATEDNNSCDNDGTSFSATWTVSKLTYTDVTGYMKNKDTDNSQSWTLEGCVTTKLRSNQADQCQLIDLGLEKTGSNVYVLTHPIKGLVFAGNTHDGVTSLPKFAIRNVSSGKGGTWDSNLGQNYSFNLTCR